MSVNIRICQIIENTDAVRTVQSRSPQGIEIQSLSDPGTVLQRIAVSGIFTDITPLIHRIGKVGRLIVL